MEMTEGLNAIITSALASLSREEENTQLSGECDVTNLTASMPELQQLKDHLDHNSDDKSKFEVRN